VRNFTKAALFFLAFYAVLPTGLSAQATDCNDPSASPEANASAQQQWENKSSPVYDDATELASTLNERGFRAFFLAARHCLRQETGDLLYAIQTCHLIDDRDRSIGWPLAPQHL
jgi:hypothetical protein